MSGEKEIRINVAKFALAIQLAVFGLIGLDKVGINIPIVRQTIIFFYLAFIPGLLILKILKIETSPIKTMLLSLCISLSFVMLFSAFENIFLASLGIERPLSEMPLTVSFSIAILILIGVCKRCNSAISFLNLKPLLAPNILLHILLCLLLPFLSIFGAYMLYVNGNYPLLMLVAIISIIPLFASLNKLQEGMYPFIIWSISFSLLCYNTLFCVNSVYETAISCIVWKAGIWDPSVSGSHNSMLATSVLLPVFSTLLKTDIVWGVKITNILLFSVIPVILYEVYTTLGFDSKTSFLSSFLFVSLPWFRGEMVTCTARTTYAILFMSILMLLIFDKLDYKKRLLSILFMFSIIVSHYGTSYLFMLILISSSLIILLQQKLGEKVENFVTFTLLYVVLALFWYLYTSGSANFNTLIGFGKNVLIHFSELFQPESSATMQAVMTSFPYISIELTRYFIYSILFFIIVGVLSLLYNHLFKGKRLLEDLEKSEKYFAFVVGYSLALMTLLLPRTSMALRIFSISLVILAPLSIVGFSTFIKLTKLNDIKSIDRRCLISFSLLLLIFLLINTGFVSNTITKNIKDFNFIDFIDKEKIQRSDDPEAKWFLYWGGFNYCPVQNLKSSEWLLRHQIPGRRIYVDDIFIRGLYLRYGNSPTLFAYLPYGERQVFNMTHPKTTDITDYLKEKGNVRGGEYIYLGYHNCVEGLIFLRNKTTMDKEFLRVENYSFLFEAESKIYNSEGCTIFYT